jgi:hypothetical protein
MRRIVPFSVLLLFCTPGVFACSCAQNNSVCATYWDAKLLFRGRVTSMTFIPDQPPPQVMVNGKLETLIVPGRLEVHFTVLEKLRGETGSETMIQTPSQSSACGVDFQEGAEYLVFGSEGQGGWWTNKCTRTHEIVNAEDDPDLLWIRGLASAKAGSTIFGTAKQALPNFEYDSVQHQPLAGLTVDLKGPVDRSVRTDSAGEFSVAGLPPGNYEVTPEFPNGLGPPAVSVVSVRDKGCAEANFFAQNDGVVDGNLFFDDLKPAEGVYMRLKRVVEADSPAWSQGLYIATTDANGHFHFEPVQAGAYVLGVNVDFPAEGSAYQRKNFYPGRSQQEQAEVLHIVGAQRVEGVRYVLPAEPDRKNVRVKVKVVDAKGAPADGSLELTSAQWPNHTWGPQTTTDEDGWEVFELPEGEPYHLFARAEDGDACAGPVSVVAQQNMEPIVLVMTGTHGSCFRKNFTGTAKE